MSTLTDKLPKFPDLTEVLDLDEAKKPLFAAVGVVDLAVEKVVESVKAQAQAQAKDLPTEAKKLQATVTEKVEALRAARAEQLKDLPAQLKAVPAELTEKATALRGELETRVAKAQTSATSYYGDLAARGEKLVAQVRKAEGPAAKTAVKPAAKKSTKPAAAKKPAAKAATKPADKPAAPEAPAASAV